MKQPFAIRHYVWLLEAFHKGLWLLEDVMGETLWPEQWPNAAKMDGTENLRKQAWFTQEVLRGIDQYWPILAKTDEQRLELPGLSWREN